jgi:phosphoglycolate phosphatase
MTTAGGRIPANLFFDLDGTLLDSLPGIRHSVSAAFAACGLEMGKTDLRAQIGPPIRTILANISAAPLDNAQLDRLVDAFRESYDSDGWRLTPHYENAASALETLRAQGRRLFVVSNKPRHISEKILAEEHTLDFFEEIVTRDTREPPYADKREMLRYLMQKWHFAPHFCLMIGDTIDDARAASYVGIPFCRMTHGYGGEIVDAGTPVAFHCDSFSDLTSIAAREWTVD